MTRLVSVITAVHAPAAQYLGDAYRSLAAQRMPVGWDWQWIVQEDGQTGEPAKLLPDDKRISAGTGRHGGPGVARTLGLARAEGEYVKVLDADDQLTPGALAREIAVLDERPEVGWTTARVLDLLPDGTTIGFDSDPDEGVLQRNVVLNFWRAHNYRAQVHPATLCLRHDLLLALGGWMALPASEDTGLLLAANAVADGYFVAEAGLLYRKWPGQMTGAAAHTEASERDARMSLIASRATALARRVQRKRSNS